MAMRGGCFIVPHSGQFDELDRWLTLKKDIKANKTQLRKLERQVNKLK